MNAVIYDLELVKRFRKGQLSEIVEIGACKVDLDSRQIIDQIQIYIAPKRGYVTKSTRKFIGMNEDDMKKAVPFRQGIETFSAWLGKDYYLCSWGKDDRLHLVDQCVRSKIPLDWFQNYNDIQKQIGKILGENTNQQLGLKNALQLAGIEAVGKAHRGIDDAVNTALLFIACADRIKLHTNAVPAKEIAGHLARYKARFRHKDAQNKELQPQHLR